MIQTRGQQEAEPARWFATPAGRSFLDAQQEVSASIVSNVFGHLGIAFRVSDVPVELLSASQVVTAFTWDCGGVSQAQRPVRAETGELPVCSGCLQLVVVHHLHEMTDRPGPMLREIERVLAPSGIAVLSGFNPVGRRLRWRPMPRWIRRWRRPQTLVPELQRIGLRPLFIRSVYRTDSVVQRLARRLDRGPLRELAQLLGSGYLIAARKSDQPARIIKSRELIRNSGRGIADTAPSAGMSPANAER